MGAGNMLNNEEVLTFELAQSSRRLFSDEDTLLSTDCDELPTISLPSVVVSCNKRFPDALFVENVSFNSIGEAKEFLLLNLHTGCKHFFKDVYADAPSCHETLFKVSISDPQCFHTTTKDVLLKVDHIPPTVYTGFHSQLNQFHLDETKNVLAVYESDKKFVNTLFWFDIEDNCPQTLNVDVTVTSNQYSHGKQMSMVVKTKNVDQKYQLKIYIEPSSCKTEEKVSNFFCESIDEMPIRFYEIIVKATDYGNNIATSTATILVIPKSDQKDHKIIHYIDNISPESERYILEKTEIEYNSN